MNEVEQLRAIQSGSADAFASWMSAAEPEIRMSLRRFAASVDTEAVLQEALLRVWQTAPRVEPDGKPNTLLRFGVRIARNLAISETRKSRPDLAPNPESLDRDLAQLAQAAVPSAPDPLLRRVIQVCREKLPPKPREVLAARLAATGAIADSDLAAQMKMKTNTFLQNFTRARKMLAECLKKNGVDLEREMA